MLGRVRTRYEYRVLRTCQLLCQVLSERGCYGHSLGRELPTGGRDNRCPGNPTFTIRQRRNRNCSLNTRLMPRSERAYSERTHYTTPSATCGADRSFQPRSAIGNTYMQWSLYRRSPVITAGDRKTGDDEMLDAGADVTFRAHLGT